MRHRIPTLVALITLAIASGAVAIQAQEQAAATRDSTPSGGVAQGIKVHGHWVIEVRNPDGSVVQRHEFDNALTTFGAVVLARLLGRDGSPSRWEIRLGSYSLPNPCQGGTYRGSVLNECFIVDPGATQPPTGTAVFPNLTTSIGGPILTQVILTGHATALVTGQIEYVATRLGTCFGNTAPSDCNVSGGGNFTVHDLRDAQGSPTPVSVAAGQIVQLTVVISFS